MNQELTGFAGGVQGGYNYQIAPGRGVVFGLEADYQLMRLRSYSQSFISDENVHIGSAIDQLALLRARAGYAFNRLLLFASGGLADGSVRLDSNITQNSNLNGAVAYSAVASQIEPRIGYVIGGGFEYAFADHMSLTIEGMYFNLGRRTISAPELAVQAGLPATSLIRHTTLSSDGLLAKAGLNYHFDNTMNLQSFSKIVSDLAGSLTNSSSVAQSDWQGEAGLLYFYSSGRVGYRLSAPGNSAQLNSRLTYADLTSHSAEIFNRVDHLPNNFFIKGFMGAGGVTSGVLRDEDFPPSIAPYSNTVSHIQDSSIAYASVDSGYTVLKESNFKFAAFAGYNYFSESMNAYGCAQTASNKNICTPAVSSYVKGLSEDAQWNSLRLGLGGEALYDRLSLKAEAAFLPVVFLDGYDHHWLRPDINALPQRGYGYGYQVEAVFSYALTPAITAGIGGRYWYMNASGTTQFPGVAASPTKYETQRFGGFVQASYHFSD